MADDETTVRINLHVPPSLKVRIEDLAREEKRSVNAQLNYMIEGYLDDRRTVHGGQG